MKNFLLLFVFFAVCGAIINNINSGERGFGEPFECYETTVPADPKEFPKSYGNVTKCYGGQRQCKTTAEKSDAGYSVVKGCGKCPEIPSSTTGIPSSTTENNLLKTEKNSFSKTENPSNCKNCYTTLCNDVWPEDDRTKMKCYTGIRMEGHDHDSFKETECPLFSTENCTTVESMMNGTKFVQKFCGSACSHFKICNATEGDACTSPHVGCWQCSGNLCNGAGPMPHASFPFVILLAFAILLGARFDAGNVLGFLF